MTLRQRLLYFSAWGKVAKARGWNTAQGRKVDRVWFAAAPDVAELHAQVWQAAEAFARMDKRKLLANDLRHGCHFVAGAPHSSGRFSNPDLDRVLALFRLLADPDDLEAMLAWQNPEAGEVKRLLASLRQAPPGYVEAIASDRFGTKGWQSLPVEDLRQLAMTVRLRMQSKRSRDAA